MTAQEELAQDHGRDLSMCGQCWKPHFNSSARCPECGAGIYWQGWSDKDRKPVATHENYARAYELQAARQRARADVSDASAAEHRAAAKTSQGEQSHD